MILRLPVRIIRETAAGGVSALEEKTSRTCFAKQRGETIQEKMQCNANAVKVIWSVIILWIF